MGVIVILITISVFVAGGFLIAFLWSVKSGQMEDDYTPSVRILFNDEVKKVASKVIDKTNNVIEKKEIIVIHKITK
jgi:cbb3-type cytochrome oxidase maturation protein